MTARVDPRDDSPETLAPPLRAVLPTIVGALKGWRQEQFFNRAVISRLLLALGLAIALWVYVTAQQNPVRTVDIANVPVIPLGLPAGYVVNAPLGTVSVRLQGLDSDLRGVTSSSLQASVDARGLTPGSPTRLLPVRIRWPGSRNLTLLERTPDSVRVGVDVTGRASVQVVVVPVGQPPAGYQPNYVQETVDPPLVTVTGLSSVLSRIQRATVEVNLTNAVGPVRVAAVPRFVDAAGNAVSSQPATITPPLVKVTIPVQQQLAFNTLPVVAQLVGVPRAGYHVSSITVSPPAVTVFGDPRAFVTLHAVTVRVSQAGIASTPRVVTSNIDLPHGVGLSPDEPVTVTLQAQPYIEQADLPAALVVRGTRSGLTATVRPTTTMLHVTGPAPQLAALARLKVAVDVAGLGPGHYRVALHPLVPSGVSLDATVPAAVDVILAARR